jgi:hypothetical protein
MKNTEENSEKIGFPNLFTIQLTFLSYFPYHFTIQPIFRPHFPYLFTIQLTFPPCFPYLFTMLGISLSELCKWGSKKWRKASWIVKKFGISRRKSKLNSEKIGKTPTYLSIYIFIRIIDFIQFFASYFPILMSFKFPQSNLFYITA